MARGVVASADLAVTPDGPLGPRHEAKEGVVQLARATGAPLIVIGAAARPRLRLGSWDRLQLPWPCARVALVMSEPLAVPRGAGPEATRAAHAALTMALARVTGEASAAVGVSTS